MQGWQDWVSLAGLILSVGGLGVTLWGLDSLARDLFPHRPLPHRQAWQWVKRHVLRQKPHLEELHVHAVLSAVGSMRVRLQALNSRPDAAAPHDEWAAYWDSRFKVVEEKIDWLTGDMGQGNSDLRAALQQETSERTAADNVLAENVRSWLGGEGGKGLTIAWCGIAVTILGTILQSIAGLAG